MGEEIQIWHLLAGIGIFLFGMYLMEESIKKLSGRALKQFIRKFTDKKLKAIASGTLATAILQSSSAVTLMVLAFVGAGIMQMPNAIGVIIGSNLGTTLTSWIVASIGFKVKIEVLALPFVGLGGLGLIFFGTSSKATNISKLMVGFGFLFMGLDYMKSSIDAFAVNFDLASLPDWGILFYLLLGFVLTALVQSSSASMAIILSAVFSGIIDFSTASAMVIGTNLGTTITVLLGSVGGSYIKKRVAMSHFIFNLGTGIIALSLLPLFNYLILDIFRLKNDPVIGLALFHTLFNLSGVIIFTPFTQLLVKLINRIIKEEQASSLYFISQHSIDIPDAALVSIKNETDLLIKRVIQHNLLLFSIDVKLVLSPVKLTADKPYRFSEKNKTLIYSDIKKTQSELFSFAAMLQEGELKEKESNLLNRYLHALRYAVASAKSLKDISHNLEEIESSDNLILMEEYESFRKKIMNYYAQIVEILDVQNDEEEVVKMHKLWKKVLQDDQELIHKITALAGNKKLNADEFSLLLTINRQLLTTERQTLTAVKDLLLTEDEAGIYENLEENINSI